MLQTPALLLMVTPAASRQASWCCLATHLHGTGCQPARRGGHVFLSVLPESIGGWKGELHVRRMGPADPCTKLRATLIDNNVGYSSVSSLVSREHEALPRNGQH